MFTWWKVLALILPLVAAENLQIATNKNDGFLEVITEPSPLRGSNIKPAPIRRHANDHCPTPPVYEDISTDERYFRSVDEALASGNNFDVVIIPSGGVDDAGKPMPMVAARCEWAGGLKDAAHYWLSSGAFTPHKPPPKDSRGQPITEGRSDALYLANELKIPRQKIIVEEMAKDTLGNAFFSRQICSLMNFKKLLIVTSKFHMLRTRITFEWVFSLPRLENLPETTKYELYFLEAPNAGLSDVEVEARVQKEADSLRHLWCNTMKNVDSLKKLASFVYFDHRAYALDDKAGTYDVVLAPEVLKSY